MNRSIFNNVLLISVFTGWFSAQLIKTALFYIKTKHFNKERIIGAGGMPSSHSAAVSAFATTAYFVYGPESFEFAFAVMLACIVMYDACGVRRAVGEHARLLNDLSTALDSILNDHTIDDKFEELIDHALDVKFKELIGHTPIQVFVGLNVGILTSLTLQFTIFT